jgi:undecaprenyl-phosphate 4-deoxy-4-formamido-L-arabinose transferase
MYMNVSVVVPVYNSELILPKLVQRVGQVLGDVCGDYELILVNDGSADDSWDTIFELAERYDWIRGINLMRNYGQHNALLCGIRAANHEVIVTMDDDLQNPPEEISGLLEKLAEGHDVVYGTSQKQQHGFWRNIASRITKLALRNTMGAKTAISVSAFRAFRAEVREAFAYFYSPFVSIDVLLTWGTTSFAAIPVRQDPRQTGSSSYTFRKLVIHALDMMTGFSTLPLQLASIMGFVFTLFGCGVFVFVVGRYVIHGGSVPGFPFLASIIAIFSGAQLFALGMIGEYLARIHFRTMKRPPYSIGLTTENRGKKPEDSRESIASNVL